ncbi:MAG: hypothetical protein KJZ90_01210 [Rhodocyclaceae bacterium]|nr:hypothetical protein [Rhodocyclaceae bacterium]
MVLAPNKARTEQIETNGSLSLEIGVDSMSRAGSAILAIRKYRTHTAEIVLASVLSRIEAGANHRDLREHVLAMTQEIDAVTSC